MSTAVIPANVHQRIKCLVLANRRITCKLAPETNFAVGTI